MKFSGVITNDQRKVHAKGQGQRSRSSGCQNQRPIVPDEWHNHTGRVAVTVDLSDGRVAIIEQNTKQSNYLKLRISHTPDIISESWKLLWREQVISHM